MIIAGTTIETVSTEMLSVINLYEGSPKPDILGFSGK